MQEPTFKSAEESDPHENNSLLYNSIILQEIFLRSQNR